MLRQITSIALALTLLVVVTGSACLACWTPGQKPMRGGCCGEHTSCHKPSKAPLRHGHNDCAAQPADLRSAEAAPLKTLQVLAFAVEPARVLEATVQPVAQTAPERAADPHYAPDLCLLNSILTI